MSASTSRPAWATDIRYWSLSAAEQARQRSKRDQALGLLGPDRGLLLLTGEEIDGSATRHEPRAWARHFCEMSEPECALAYFPEGVEGVEPGWALYVPEPDFRSLLWEGYRLGSARCSEALGITGRPIDQLAEHVKALGASGRALARELGDSSAQLRDLLSAFHSGRDSFRGAKSAAAELDAESLLLASREIADEREIGWMRESAKIAGLGHVGAMEALWRGIARERHAARLAGSAATQSVSSGGSGSADGEAAAPDWESPGGLGPLGKAALSAGISAPLSERTLEAAFLATTVSFGADGPAYAPICAAGENALCLHWRENRRGIFEEDWVLLDMGCAKRGWRSDITRTLPASGRFTGLRGDLYRLLLSAQLLAIDAAVEGADFEAPDRAARDRLIEGLLAMNLLRPSWAGEDGSKEGWERRALQAVFPHRTSHFLGRLTHDVGASRGADGAPRKLLAGMRVTVEPGLYFHPDLDELPDELQGFGARIEDDCAIAAGGQPPEVLSRFCPKDPEALEAIARSCGL